MATPPEGVPGALPSLNELIGVQAPDEAVAKLQLAARWAERFGPDNDDLLKMLGRFKRAYDYLDAVTHGVLPDDAS